MRLLRRAIAGLRVPVLVVICVIASLTVPQHYARADGPVSIDTARAIAVSFLTGKAQALATSSGKPQAPSPAMVSGVFTESRQGTPLYYTINLDPEGWVIVAANYVSRPIIAYSTTGTASAENRPPEFEEWMGDVAEDIHNAISRRMRPLPEAQAEWSDLLAGASPQSTPLATSVSPLLSTIWGQGGNDQMGWDPCCWIVPWLPSEDLYCPGEVNWAGYYRVAPTGCVATAMGQIMKRWNWPPSGRGSHTWDPPFPAYGPYTVDFGARTYDWAIMPNDVVPYVSGFEPAGNREVAKLLRDIGVAVEMEYEPGGSGACLWQNSGSPGYCNIGCSQTSFSRHGGMKAFKDYFRYHTPTYTGKYCKTDAQWIALLKSELDAGRPILYEGSGSGGHAFVCDGYDASNNFHFNWGWDGSYNGYYSLTDLTPGSHNYTSDQGALYNIRPDTPPVAVCKPVTLYLNQSGQAVLQPSDVNNGSYDPDGGPVTLSVNVSQFNCTHHGGTYPVTLTVTDSTGNTASCNTSVTVIDNAPPTVRTRNATVYLDAGGQASITVAEVNDGSTDNCGVASMTISPGSFTCADVGPNTVTLAVTDVHGVAGSGTSTVTVLDETAPVLSGVPADMTVEYDAVPPPADVTATDNCGADVQFAEVRTDGACPNFYTLTRTWTAADGSGNSISATQIITVQDTTTPESDLCPRQYRWSTLPGHPARYEWKPYPIVFKSWQQVRLLNSGPGMAYNVTASITCTPVNVTILDGAVSLGDIPAGSMAWSTDDYALSTDLAYSPLPPANKGIAWRIEYDDAAGCHHVIENVPQFCGAPVNCP